MMRFIASHSPRNADNLLTDGKSALAYRELPAVFAAIEASLAGIAPGDCAALEAENTLPAALLLLALLERGQSVLLLPGGASAQGVPAFCRHVLRTSGESLQPAVFLARTDNPDWRGWETDAVPKLLMRTSGSTGTAKIAVFTHDKLRDNALHCVQRFGLSEIDRVAIPAPIYHMYGLGAAFLPSLAAGASVDLQKGANLLKFIQREAAFEPNVAFMTPSFASTLLQTRKTARPYRLTVTAGDRFRVDRFAAYEAMFGPLAQLYGSTEQGAIAAASPDLPLEIRQISAGLPMPDVEFRLEPPGSGEGELWCKRACGFEGYVDSQGRPLDLGEDYADPFDKLRASGWFRTKDFARISPQGYVEVLGRSDHSLNRDALLVFFADVEKVIESLAGVDSVAVLAGGEAERGKKLIACCVLAPNSGLTAEAVRAHCLARLPRRAVPDEVRIEAALPLLPNGKIDRIQLQNLLTRG